MKLMMSSGDPVVCFAGDGLDICVFENLFAEFGDASIVLLGIKILCEDEGGGWQVLRDFIGFLCILHCLSI